MGDSLQLLVRAATDLFVLSLAVERITELFKRRDLQPLSFRFRRIFLALPIGLVWLTRRAAVGRLRGLADLLQRAWKGSRSFHVDLRTQQVYAPDGSEIRVSEKERDRLLRAVQAENTALIGISLALVLRIDAFAPLAAAAEPGSWATTLASGVRVVATGLAAGIGSSFWYDLLKMLAAVRQARQGGPQPEGPSKDEDPMALVEAQRAGMEGEAALARAADTKLEELRGEGLKAVVGPWLDERGAARLGVFLTRKPKAALGAPAGADASGEKQPGDPLVELEESLLRDGLVVGVGGSPPEQRITLRVFETGGRSRG